MHRGQNVYECFACRVAMTLAAEQEQRSAAITRR